MDLFCSGITEKDLVERQGLRLKTKSRKGLCFFANWKSMWYNIVKKKGKNAVVRNDNKQQQEAQPNTNVLH